SLAFTRPASVTASISKPHQLLSDQPRITRWAASRPIYLAELVFLACTRRVKPPARESTAQIGWLVIPCWKRLSSEHGRVKPCLLWARRHVLSPQPSGLLFSSRVLLNANSARLHGTPAASSETDPNSRLRTKEFNRASSSLSNLP